MRRDEHGNAVDITLRLYQLYNVSYDRFLRVV